MSYAGTPNRYSDFYGDPYGEPEATEPHKRRLTRLVLTLAIVGAMVLVGAAAFAGTVLLGGGGANSPGSNPAAQGNGPQPEGVTIGDPSLPGGFADDARSPEGPTPGEATAEETPSAEAPSTEPEPSSTTVQPTPNRPRQTTKAVPVPESATELRVLALVNTERAKVASRTGRNCPALSIEPRLANAARKHSADMVSRRYFAHDSPDKVNVGQRVISAGYQWSTVGENIAKGQPNADAVMDAWMKSPGHAANITNCRYVHIGIGIVLDGRSPVWTQDFAAPR